MGIERSDSEIFIDENELAKDWSPQDWQLIKKMYEIGQKSSYSTQGYTN